MTVLLDISVKKSYQNNLKKKLVKEFSDLLMFTKIDSKTSEVIISTVVVKNKKNNS